ncbi:MAG: glycosyltransferase family 39 protein [candidate division Zixibacteria bacterium]|nr:glycosyltransferase family 39 protein [candidate division Zixibacteria bacterium]
MTKNTIIGRLESLSTTVVVVAAVSFIGYFLVLAIMRAQYPFELEWMEGSMVDHIVRILHGQALYCKPSLEFVPLRYAPLYYYLGAVISSVMGIGFLPLRLISIISALGCFTLIYMIVKRETGSWKPALVAAGFFAATYPVTGSFMDIARVDSLSLCLTLGGIYVFRHTVTVRQSLLAGLLFALAFLAKQSALPIAAAVLLSGLVRDWRHVLWTGSTLAIILILSTVVLNIAYDGWYSLYVFDLGSEIIFKENPFILLLKLGYQLFKPFGIAMLFSLWYLFNRLHHDFRSTGIFFFLMAGGMICATYLSRIQPHGWINTFMPAAAAFAILLGLAVDRLLTIVKDKYGQHTVWHYVPFLLILQFGILTYDPRPHLPTAEDEAAGWELIAMIESIDGEVFLPFHGHLASIAGKGRYLHSHSILDFTGPEGERLRQALDQEIKEAISKKQFETIILDRYWYMEEIARHYRIVGPVFNKPDVFLPVTGCKVRPSAVYVIRQD